MHVSLTSELEARIKAKVDSGLYNNASEVVREALRFMETHDEWVKELKLAKLREQLKVGEEQIMAGNSIEVKSETELDALFTQIKG
ncbi:type II toxin-antitoxin system ParD family antitoxin [Marinomonas sp. GJ51-6]|uniref:type II toxin-antitoxin system ParD family antitoxin n=1 Tax=Marinomonas sp. GJ51-6 TaxID=2992802 RepID=UPI002934FFBD|nr:type II toxin-antitoxin system ParD family antitoxin [Marinomonas sp. GJ51-6]WOD06768.1 type II toxin-antitoxin system ParD family antitoxin [Marinomonas sp. GJ51-6]